MTTGFAPIRVIPQSLQYEFLLTSISPVSHHDPAVQDDSNRMLFNRQKQLLVGSGSTALPAQHQVDALCYAHPVPADVVDIFSQLSLAEFVGTALTRTFLDFYNRANGGEGEGLFSGMERYSRLETRLRMAAVVAPTLRSWWNRLCSSLQVSIHGGGDDALLFGLLSVPSGLQQLVLRALADDYRSIVALARLWHTQNKLANPLYAEKAGQSQAGEPTGLSFDAKQIPAGSSVAQVMEIPAVSGNSLRHQVVREPAWLHLCEQLGLRESTPGKGPVPAGVEAIFYNGGNIAAGAKQPSNVFGLAQAIRAAYPSLDLLGGVTDSFDVGESRLNVAGWLVCRENRDALVDSPSYDLPAATVSAYDLLDDVTLTRQAGETGLGQMIFSFETLCPGAQVLCRLNLSPFTGLRTQGALVAAVETFVGNGPTMGGQAARGFGHCRGEWLTGPETANDVRQEYEDYLAANRETLCEGLRDGTLGTGTRIFKL